MYALNNAVHDLHYRVNYMIIDYKQRLYSDNRNPRIIQTKLKNQPLLSLRTTPNDKYKVKPGEFLSLENNGPSTHVSKIAANPNIQAILDGMFDESFLPLSKVVGSAVVRPSPACSCECRCGLDVKSSIASVDDVLIDLTKPKFWFWKKKQCQHERVPESRNYTRDDEPTEENVENPKELEVDIEKEKSPGSKRFVSYLESLKEIFPNPSLAPSTPPGSQGAWRTVFNDISLSAARVSTGHSPKSKNDFQNLSSDFIAAKAATKSELPVEWDSLRLALGAKTDAKKENTDVFAVNLEEARAQFRPPTSYGDFYTLLGLYDSDSS